MGRSLRTGDHTCLGWLQHQPEPGLSSLPEGLVAATTTSGTDCWLLWALRKLGWCLPLVERFCLFLRLSCWLLAGTSLQVGGCALSASIHQLQVHLKFRREMHHSRLPHSLTQVPHLEVDKKICSKTLYVSAVFFWKWLPTPSLVTTLFFRTQYTAGSCQLASSQTKLKWKTR